MQSLFSMAIGRNFTVFFSSPASSKKQQMTPLRVYLDQTYRSFFKPLWRKEYARFFLLRNQSQLRSLHTSLCPSSSMDPLIPPILSFLPFHCQNVYKSTPERKTHDDQNRRRCQIPYDNISLTPLPSSFAAQAKALQGCLDPVRNQTFWLGMFPFQPTGCSFVVSLYRLT